METNDKVETSNEQTKKDFRFDDFQADNSNEPDLKTESKVEEEIGAGLDQEKNEAPNCIKILEQFPDEAVPELIYLVHGNTNNKNFLAKEFSKLWQKKHELVKISIKKITVKIQEIAEYQNSEALSRKAWMVKDQFFLKQYGILEPDIPSKWNYILEQEKVFFPDEAVPELISLVHANTNYKNFLAKEFSEFWHKKHKLVKISIKRITTKIQEIAEYQNSEALSRKAWMVKGQFLNGILEPDIPNKWNYILAQPGEKTTAAAEECGKDLDQEKNKAPNYNSSAYFYLSGSGGQKGPYPGIPNTTGLSEDESRGKIIEHFNKAQPTFISPEDINCDKTELSAGKKSKKTQKEELKALAEETNEANIEMKLEPDSKEKPPETFDQESLIKSYKPKRNKIRIPKDKSEFEEISKVLIGFPNTEGLSEEVARSAILEYWMNSITWRGKNYIPKAKHLSRYPGFPKTEGLPKEEVDEAVQNFWTEWQKNKTYIPKAFWKEPTALVPKDKSRFPGFPNIEGLPKEEADRSIIEFWKKEKLNIAQDKQDRKMEFREKFKK
jgi:hypothetical protein